MKKIFKALFVSTLFVSTMSSSSFAKENDESKKITESKILEFNETSAFEEQVSKAELPVLVFMYAPWCKYCKLADPIVLDSSKEYEGKVKFIKINTDKNKELSKRFSIRGIPTLLLFKKNELVEKFDGAPEKQELKDLIEKHL